MEKYFSISTKYQLMVEPSFLNVIIISKTMTLSRSFTGSFWFGGQIFEKNSL